MEGQMKLHFYKFLGLAGVLVVFFDRLMPYCSIQTSFLEKKASCLLFGIALSFTLGFTGYQYLFLENIKAAHWTCRLLIGLLCAIMGGVLVLIGAEFILGSDFPWSIGAIQNKGWLSIFMPTAKNWIVVIIAIVLLVVDFQLIYAKNTSSNEPFKQALRHQVVAEDIGVVVSLLLAGLFVGGLNNLLGLSPVFISAFNSGVLCFHLFLGTMLFEGIS